MNHLYYFLHFFRLKVNDAPNHLGQILKRLKTIAIYWWTSLPIITLWVTKLGQICRLLLLCLRHRHKLRNQFMNFYIVHRGLSSGLREGLWGYCWLALVGQAGWQRLAGWLVVVPFSFFFEAAASNICLPSFRPSFLLQRLSWRQTMTIEIKKMMLTSK